MKFACKNGKYSIQEVSKAASDLAIPALAAARSHCGSHVGSIAAPRGRPFHTCRVVSSSAADALSIPLFSSTHAPNLFPLTLRPQQFPSAELSRWHFGIHSARPHWLIAAFHRSKGALCLFGYYFTTSFLGWFISMR